MTPILSSKQLRPIVEELLEGHGVHHELGITSAKVRNYRQLLKDDKLNLRMMLDICNLGGRLGLKDVKAEY